MNVFIEMKCLFLKIPGFIQNEHVLFKKKRIQTSRILSKFKSKQICSRFEFQVHHKFF